MNNACFWQDGWDIPPRKEESMFWVDAHCDTLSTGRDLYENTGHFDIQRGTARGAGVQILAAFGANKPEQFIRFTRECGNLAGLRPDQFSVLPAVEGGDDITCLDDLTPYLDAAFFGLTWNHDNALAGGCHGENGLTALGRDAVRMLEDHGVVVDLAHASARTFWDVLEVARRPVAVTHACCAALCPHPRNLTDAQLAALAKNDGVVGVTFYPPFLRPSGRADWTDVVAHILHATKVAGAEHVGIGSDFDGVEQLPCGILSCEDLPALIDCLPFDVAVRRAVAGENFLRLLRNTGRWTN